MMQSSEDCDRFIPVPKGIKIIILLIFVFMAGFGMLFGISMVSSHIGFIKKDNTTRNEIKM